MGRVFRLPAIRLRRRGAARSAAADCLQRARIAKLSDWTILAAFDAGELLRRRIKELGDDFIRSKAGGVIVDLGGQDEFVGFGPLDGRTVSAEPMAEEDSTPASMALAAGGKSRS